MMYWSGTSPGQSAVAIRLECVGLGLLVGATLQLICSSLYLQATWLALIIGSDNNI